MSFMSQAIKGDVSLDEIDDFVERWHSNVYSLYARNGDLDVPLAEYLGMSTSEYSRWVRDHGCLKTIVEERREAWPFPRASDFWGDL
jgi:hypothetical protein